MIISLYKKENNNYGIKIRFFKGVIEARKLKKEYLVWVNNSLINNLKIFPCKLFFEILKSQINAGIPLKEAVSYSKSILKNNDIEIKIIEENLEDGKSLSEAIEHISEIRHFHKAILKIGEISGKFDESLGTVSEFYKEEDEIKGKMFQGLIYPLFIMIFGMLMLSMISIFALPKIIDVLNESGNVNFFIKVLGDKGILAFPIFMILVILCFINKKNIYSFILEYTSTGQLFEIWKFTLSMGYMLEAGISIKKSLDIIEKETDSFQKIVSPIIEEIKNGEILSNSLEKQFAKETYLVGMIRKGEVIGNLAESFFQSAKIYKEKLLKKVDLFVKLIEPITIILITICVFIFIIVVIIPVIKHMESIGG